MKHGFSFLLTWLAALLLSTGALAQGTTTAALNGLITDGTGQPVPGATVVATHLPTNSIYAMPTNDQGRYNFQNMRVGGPYTVRFTSVGSADQTRDNLYLALGQNLRLDVKLAEQATELGTAVVEGRRDDVINAGRTGAATRVSREQIEQLPTINRTLQDFVRLTPQAQAGAGGGTSFGGSNNRYNNITIDGAVNNDVFGLAGSGTPGGQAGTQPIALDAIQEIQVVVAPYDVKLGNFTGGGINAVTRSGTNAYTGSAYGFWRNESLIGKSVTEPRTKATEVSNYFTGVRVGGPIIKDKLFFFVNGELSRRSEPVLQLPGTSESQFTVAELNQARDFLQTRFGYDAGGFGEIVRRTNSNKIFARLDWNISDKHQLTLRHNFVDAFDDNLSRSSVNLRLGSNGYQFNSVTNSTVLELNSRLGAFSNNLILSASRVRDNREPEGALFPSIEIRDAGRILTAGSERSSVANELDQDVYEITDNLTRVFGVHTITLGTHNEFFSFRNLFLNNLNGRYEFGSLSAPAMGANTSFYDLRPLRLRATYSLDPNNKRPAAEFNAAQLGFYVQDEYTPLPNLRLTLGVRLDVPVLPNAPTRNLDVDSTFGPDFRTDNTPSGQLLWAPRLGFNYNPDDANKLQIRGGTGLFTGRVPFVWLSNNYINTGLTLGTIDVRPGSGPTGTPLPFESNPDNFPSVYSQGLVRTREINLIGKDFKIPQVWRSNLAVDYRLPGDLVLTLEGIYSKTVNDIYYRDLNLQAPAGTLGGADNRPIYASGNARRVNPAFTNALLLDNTSRGDRYSLTAQAQKRFTGGLNVSGAYTYGKSTDINSGQSSTALSNWEFNQISRDPNSPDLSFSRNDIRHRFLATGGYTFRYANDRLATTLSFVYEGQSGRAFTYLYGQGGSDLNNDGAFGNDLLYVPRSQEEILLAPTGASDTRTPDQIWQDLNNFIENDEYLSSRRGQIAERNGARMPWTHQIDIRLAQDLRVKTGENSNTLQLTLDVINFGNLLNKDWGHQYFVNNEAYELLRVQRFEDISTTPLVRRPVFSFPKIERAYDIAALASRWQMQLGLRYSFN